MPNYAKVTLVGHLGAEPELKFLPDGTPILKLRLAVNTGFKDKKVCSWYQADWFGGRAEKLTPHLFKGQALLVEGELSMREWTDKNSNIRLTPTIRVGEVVPLTWANERGQGAQGDAAQGEPAPSQGPAQPDLGEDVPF